MRQFRRLNRVCDFFNDINKTEQAMEITRPFEDSESCPKCCSSKISLTYEPSRLKYVQIRWRDHLMCHCENCGHCYRVLPYDSERR
jgi:hypothetical protein